MTEDELKPYRQRYHSGTFGKADMGVLLEEIDRLREQISRILTIGIEFSEQPTDGTDYIVKVHPAIWDMLTVGIARKPRGKVTVTVEPLGGQSDNGEWHVVKTTDGNEIHIEWGWE